MTRSTLFHASVGYITLLILKNSTLEVERGERIAVVTRTGAVKITLSMALIRGLEADYGQIARH
ncbi:hypothetical protein EYZ11_007301 [Aspergillus tanneri]|uniref:Uncharacterized protein n=1 Tax=Aspergillus tanneri TaxID=1220188 RepID=A0A4S3JDB0_9EURO|nr:hypothetical protein EYZ11_007301 [Aspergillus tanneri]